MLCNIKLMIDWNDTCAIFKYLNFDLWTFNHNGIKLSMQIKKKPSVLYNILKAGYTGRRFALSICK